ncbi:MAG TPA: TIGR03619 family F420-dependent LLM class oxidoreductase [Candidatus Binataceae bacterium]|nr:TIGR03619 family F420-dependent LLM class oxidoreductase [Candidatus Binataceae bacterium]
MDIGIYATTHGIGYRDETDFYLRSAPMEEMRPVQAARLAEAAGFHSMWFPDHVCMPTGSSSAHVANASGKRAYEARHDMLDAAVTMGAVAVSTTTLKLGTSVLIAPYRNPLSDARQFATVDLLSRGRLMLGVGAGWMKEEFAVLGLPYAERGAMANECIEIFKRSWTADVVDFRGRFYNFEQVSMDPKPVQKPRPPIIFGGVVPAGARRAIRHCDGFYPIFLDPQAEPNRYAPLQDEIRREADRLGRDVSKFFMMAVVSGRLTSPSEQGKGSKPRPICTGSAADVLADLQRFADAGYSLAVFILDCFGKAEELEAQIQRFGEEVIKPARSIRARGGWASTPVPS